MEATNALPYGWMAAKHIEPARGIFSIEDKDNMKSQGDRNGGQKGH